VSLRGWWRRGTTCWRRASAASWASAPGRCVCKHLLEILRLQARCFGWLAAARHHLLTARICRGLRIGTTQVRQRQGSRSGFRIERWLWFHIWFQRELRSCRQLDIGTNKAGVSLALEGASSRLKHHSNLPQLCMCRQLGEIR